MVDMAAQASKRQLEEARNDGVALMLLGSVSFMMGLFYITNLKNQRRASDSWSVISATISIFAAVLLFQGVNGVLESVFLQAASEKFELLVNFTHMMFWLCGLQLFLAWVSGAIGKTPEATDEHVRSAKLNLMCFAVLLGHITAFAAISTFAIAQAMIPGGIIFKFLACPVAWFYVSLLGKVFDYCREAIATADDGEKDKFEELWDDHAEETEDDIIGLAVSFLGVQAMRLTITGNLPNAEGDENEESVAEYSNWYVVMLLCCGLILFIFEGLRLMMIRIQFKRFSPQLQNVVAMTNAWAIFFAADWFFSINVPALEGMMKRVTCALLLTSGAMLLIFVLEGLENTVKNTSAQGESFGVQRVDKFIKSCVKSLAILVGFSWEKSFDKATESVTEVAHGVPEYATKMLLAIALAGIVVPAWRIHILPHMLSLEEKEKEEDTTEAQNVQGAEDSMQRTQRTSQEENESRRAVALARQRGVRGAAFGAVSLGDMHGRDTPGSLRTPLLDDQSTSFTRNIPTSGLQQDSSALPVATPAVTSDSQSVDDISLQAGREASTLSRVLSDRSPSLHGSDGQVRQFCRSYEARAAQFAKTKKDVDDKLNAVMRQLDALEKCSADLMDMSRSSSERRRAC